MTDIHFYHLLTTPLEKALPRLMDKALKSGMRAVIYGTEQQVENLDRSMWTFSPNAFLPHGTHKDPMPEEQPVYLSPKLENPNGATLLVITHGEQPLLDSGYARVIDMFDGGNDAEVTSARQRWSDYKKAGHSLTYIKQKDDGGWEKIAEAA
ncbi:MAG: DNA polymerase III subunit chi [Rickettsiales bacterium]